MKSPAYKPFFDRFTTLLDSSSPIKIMQHYNLSPTPSSLAKDSTKPTFELFVPKIKQGSSYDQLEKSFLPLLVEWEKKQDRRAAIARAVDTKRGQQEQDKVLLVVPWKSSKEHEEGKKEEIFIKVLEQARKCWDGVELYAHVNVTGGRD